VKEERKRISSGELPRNARGAKGEDEELLLAEGRRTEVDSTASVLLWKGEAEETE
jgi:hypothetical protein